MVYLEVNFYRAISDLWSNETYLRQSANTNTRFSRQSLFDPAREHAFVSFSRQVRVSCGSMLVAVCCLTATRPRFRYHGAGNNIGGSTPVGGAVAGQQGVNVPPLPCARLG